MNTYQADSAREWIWNHLDQRAFRTLSEEKLKAMIADFVQYDLHFMRVSGVLNALDAPGEADYDEDEAFEFIYDAYLSDHPEDEDDDMEPEAEQGDWVEDIDDAEGDPEEMRFHDGNWDEDSDADSDTSMITLEIIV